MKLVAIMGSPHGVKGNTGKLLGSLLQAAEAAGAETTLLCLGDLTIAPCRACDSCHRTGTCAQDDDFQKVLDAMLECDALVLASPNYIFSVSAQMKALLDRCCGALHVLAMWGKYGAAVVSSGGAGSDEVESYMLRFLQALGCWTVGSVGSDAARLFDAQASAEVLQQAASLGTRLVEAATNGERFAEQQAALATRAEYMRKLVTSRRDHWTYEFGVWESRGQMER
jgi:multimeric flavodoxin WrbA